MTLLPSRSGAHVPSPWVRAGPRLRKWHCQAFRDCGFHTLPLTLFAWKQQACYKEAPARDEVQTGDVQPQAWAPEAQPSCPSLVEQGRTYTCSLAKLQIHMQNQSLMLCKVTELKVAGDEATMTRKISQLGKMNGTKVKNINITFTSLCSQWDLEEKTLHLGERCPTDFLWNWHTDLGSASVFLHQCRSAI